MPIRTQNSPKPPIDAEPEPEDGCAYVIEENRVPTAGRTCCAAPRRPGSVYCHAHHALCYLPSDSPAERRKLKEIEALAAAVGGKNGRPARQPPPRLMRRLDRVSRAALRPDRSRNVPMHQESRGEN